MPHAAIVEGGDRVACSASQSAKSAVIVLADAHGEDDQHGAARSAAFVAGRIGSGRRAVPSLAVMVFEGNGGLS